LGLVAVAARILEMKDAEEQNLGAGRVSEGVDRGLGEREQEDEGHGWLRRRGSLFRFKSSTPLRPYVVTPSSGASP
jgi:hypothetical protein